MSSTERISEVIVPLVECRQEERRKPGARSSRERQRKNESGKGWCKYECECDSGHAKRREIPHSLMWSIPISISFASDVNIKNPLERRSDAITYPHYCSALY